MKKIKLFDFYNEINPILTNNNLCSKNFFEYQDNISNDSAILWHIEDEDDEEDKLIKVLNNYFINQDCIQGEEILIWVSW